MDLQPLTLNLAALVTLEIKLFKVKKTLFRTNLWRYTTPTIHKRVLEIGAKEEDKSPPDFVPYEETKVSAARPQGQYAIPQGQYARPQGNTQDFKLMCTTFKTAQWYSMIVRWISICCEF